VSSEEERKLANLKRRASREATAEKRKSQVCKVISLKIDESSLSDLQAEFLKMSFVEAKWIWNEAVSSEDIYKHSTKGNAVTHLDKDGNKVESELRFIGSDVKQELHKQIISNIKTLSTLKKQGKKVGRIGFKSEINSLNLRQCGTSYKFKSHRQVVIAPTKVGGKSFRIFGGDQLFSRSGKLKFELANAKLIHNAGGYFLNVTCFSKKQVKKTKGDLGIDLGISSTVTTSDGRKFNVSVQESDRLKKLQRKFARQQKGSRRRYRTLLKIRREYLKMGNRKKDMANKICHELLQHSIYMQDENITGWKKLFGRQVQRSALGLIKAKLKANAVVCLSRWEPTTKLCTSCGQVHKLTLTDRRFVCDCGVDMDRDVHAAMNMIVMGKKQIGQELPEFTLVETLSDFRSPWVSEAGVGETRRSRKENPIEA
jgi:putative transposase